MADALVELVHQLPRERLDRLDAPPAPGAYLQFLDAPHLGEVFGEPTATGCRAAYVGVASSSLRARVPRYRRALAGISELSEHQVWVTLVPCASTASARFAESALIERLCPVLQGLGWGSRPPGAGRPGTTTSPIHALLAGRDWARPAESWTRPSAGWGSSSIWSGRGRPARGGRRSWGPTSAR